MHTIPSLTRIFKSCYIFKPMCSVVNISFLLEYRDKGKQFCFIYWDKTNVCFGAIRIEVFHKFPLGSQLVLLSFLWIFLLAKNSSWTVTLRGISKNIYLMWITNQFTNKQICIGQPCNILNWLIKGSKRHRECILLVPLRYT